MHSQLVGITAHSRVTKGLRAVTLVSFNFFFGGINILQICNQLPRLRCIGQHAVEARVVIGRVPVVTAKLPENVALILQCVFSLGANFFCQHFSRLQRVHFHLK